MEDFEQTEKKDIPELYALQLRAFESEAEMIGSRSIPALMKTLEEHTRDFENWTVLVKRDAFRKIIGAVRFRESDDHIEIGRLMVDPDHRNQGLATRLMLLVEEYTGGSVFELYTCTKSYTNIRLYEKLDYRTYKVENSGNGLSFAYMRKIIPRQRSGMLDDPGFQKKLEQLDELAMRYETSVMSLCMENYLEEFCDFFEIKNRNLKLLLSPDGFYGTLRELSGYDTWQPIAEKAESLFGLPNRVMVLRDNTSLRDELEGPDGLGPFFFIFDLMFCEYDAFTLCFISGTNN